MGASGKAALGPRERLGLRAEARRALYYRSLLGTLQTAKMYAAWAIRRRAVSLRVPEVAHPVVCRREEPDRFTLCHVFKARECEVPVGIEPELIVDAGANVGYASVFYANAYPSARIIAIEPDPGNIALARRNCAPYPQVELVHAGLWPRDRPVVIANPEARSWGYAVRETAAGETGAVAGISLPALLERESRERIDILKLDIEGAEVELFTDGWKDWLPRVGVVVVETHGAQSESLVDAAMREARFRLVREHPRRVYAHPDVQV